MKNNKGSSATELVLISPFVLIFMISFFKLFKISVREEHRLIALQQSEREDLRRRELAGSILDRPCEVDPKFVLIENEDQNENRSPVGVCHFCRSSLFFIGMGVAPSERIETEVS